VSIALLLVGFGILQGMRHAFEPDHLAAVSTFGARGQSTRGVLRFAAAWSAGHGAVLLLVSGALLMLGKAMPARWTTLLESIVALTLIALGVRAIWHAHILGRVGANHQHVHGDEVHRHQVAHSHLHVGSETFATLPFVVGIVHGLAGSGSLAALAAPRAGSLWGGLAFVVAYVVGTALGMIALAAVLAGPLGQIASGRVRSFVLALSGALSVLVGVYWGALLV
jgi:ABC-type nickel/cobalt efflux system permease component RcnA